MQDRSSRLLSRRDALRAFGGIAVVASGARRAASAASPPAPSDSVRLRLWAGESSATILPGKRTPVWSFGAEVLDGDPRTVVPSGSYLGPTLRFRNGQRVRITFENRLADHSIVHWHGLHLPQRQDGQPAEAIDGGTSYEYDFVIDSDPGTFWYHPHPHQHTGDQVYRGLAGLIHIAGNEPPGLPTAANDVGIVLQDRSFNADGTLRYVGFHHDVMAGFVGDTLVTNGVAGYSLEVRREPYRLRLLNGANSRTQLLRLSNGAAFTVLATDGHFLQRPVRTNRLVLTPAQRADLWIDFSSVASGGRVELLTTDLFIEGGGLGDLNARAGVAATFIAGGAARPGTPPSRLAVAPAALPVSAARAVNRSAPKQFVLSTRRMTHWINDRTYEGRDVTPLETVKAGSIELWDFVNQSPIPHPMHLHGRAFQVVRRSWDSDALAKEWDRIATGVIETGPRDTVLVWPGQRVQIAVPFGPHKGFFLYHCHVLEHEDTGMMRSFRVV